MAKPKTKNKEERIVFPDAVFRKDCVFLLFLIGRYDKRRFGITKRLPLPINLLDMQMICFRKGIQKDNMKLLLRQLQKYHLVEELRRENNIPFYGINQTPYSRYLWQFSERYYYHTLAMLLDDIYNDTWLETQCKLWDFEFPVNPKPNLPNSPVIFTP